MKVKFITYVFGETNYLTINNVYEVVEICASNYRIINDCGEPILFSPEYFEIIDPITPGFWITYYDEEGNKYSKPEKWSKSYFFEDYFNSIPPIVESFWKDCRELYGIKYFVVPDFLELYSQQREFEVTCISRHTYLRETQTKNTFELISKDINPYQMEDISLTIGKKYIVEESRRHYWYKIKDDNGKYYFFPKSMFEGWEL